MQEIGLLWKNGFQMKKYLCFLFVSCLTSAQINGQGKTDILGEKIHDYDKLEEISSLRSQFIIQNNGNQDIFLLRADASKKLKIRSYKKRITPGDTTALEIYFTPTSAGKFNEEIQLITSDRPEPIRLRIKGDIQKITGEGGTACYAFGKPITRRSTIPEIIIPKERPPKKTDTNAICIATILPLKDSAYTYFPKQKAPPYPGELNPELYKYNNVIFLVDVSGSMIDSNKLRWLKLSMKKLIKNSRLQDRITLVTYRDSVKCVAENFNASDSTRLYQFIQELKPKGITRGNKAIHFATDLAVKHYLEQGNNQIILATDGEFPFSERDYKTWNEKIGNRQIVLSVLAFGNEKKALENLKEISRKGKGSFVQVKTREMAQNAVLEEIKSRSRK